MKKIFIVGGDGFARECYLMIKKIADVDSSVQFGGFLGHGGYGAGVDYKTFQHLYKGEVAEYAFAEDDYVVIGAGYPVLRQKIYNDLKKQGVKFYTLVSEYYILDDSIELGEANIFIPPFCPTMNIRIGNGNVFNGDVIVGHDVDVGDFNFFGARTQILGNVKVGNSNTIGVNAILLPHAKVGNNNKIAPLSAIYKGCKNNGYYVGNPALKIGEVE